MAWIAARLVEYMVISDAWRWLRKAWACRIAETRAAMSASKAVAVVPRCQMPWLSSRVSRSRTATPVAD
jgi:hypothetical protein